MTSRYLGTGIDLGGQKLSGVGDPSAPADAVTLAYLQAFIRGLAWKQFARAASTGNVTLSGPGAAIDGVALAAGDRVLLKNQTAPAENGVYVWNGAASALTRATDLNSEAGLRSAVVPVTEGTANKDTLWIQTTDGAIVVGTTAIAWTPLPGGTGATYTNGNGLDLTGSTFSVKVANGLIVDATGVRVDPTIVARKFSVNAANALTTTVTHNLGTLDVIPVFRDIATGEIVDADYTATSVNAGTATFATAPAVGAIRITIHA